MRLITQLVFTKLSLSLLVAICLVGFTGCGDSGKKTTSTSQADDHSDDDHGDDHAHGDHQGHAEDDDHQHPESYEEAVAQLVKMNATIKDGFANDDIDAAHGPLHDVAHLLEDIEALVKESDKDEAAKKSIAAAIESLFGFFGAIDDKQHGLEGKDYDEVADDIAAAIKTLQDQQ